MGGGDSCPGFFTGLLPPSEVSSLRTRPVPPWATIPNSPPPTPRAGQLGGLALDKALPSFREATELHHFLASRALVGMWHLVPFPYADGNVLAPGMWLCG